MGNGQEKASALTSESEGDDDGEASSWFHSGNAKKIKRDMVLPFRKPFCKRKRERQFQGVPHDDPWDSSLVHPQT